jgi:hypothetical protein
VKNCLVHFSSLNDFLAAIQREIEMVRKMEMAREMEKGRRR